MAEVERGESLPKHILPAAGTMLGICTTLIGLVKVVEPHAGPSRVDEYSSFVAVLFLVSAMASYASLRDKSRRGSHGLQRAADVSFVIGLIGLAAISLMFAHELI